MSMSRAELAEAAAQAFPPAALMPDAAASWATLTEMGWWTMTVPEALGGLGLGAEAAASIHHALGAALVPGAAMAQMLVIEALAATAPSAERDALLGRAMAGEPMTAALSGTGAGAHLCAAPDADRATQLLLVRPDRIALVPADAPGTAPSLVRSWDETRRLFDVSLPDEAGLDLARGAAASTLARRLEAWLHIALAADSLGLAETVLGLSIDYLKTRRQFDRPLAMFQALKHRCADHKTALAAAQALLWQVVAVDPLDPARAAALKAHACRVALEIAEDAIQLHGGIGLTMEHHCHRFLKRAFLNAALGGDHDALEEAAGRRVLG